MDLWKSLNKLGRKRSERRRTRWRGMAQSGPGRVRQRLAKVLLRDLNVIVDPYDLWTQEGGYRNHHWDLARWGTNNAFFTEEEAERRGLRATLHFHLSSWDTMSESCKKGVCWVGDKFTTTDNEVSVR